jgi:hypothetical protein
MEIIEANGAASLSKRELRDLYEQSKWNAT